MVHSRSAESPCAAEGVPEAVLVFPRRKIGQGDSVSPETDRQYQYQRRRRPCEFTYAAIAERFDRPQAEAARAFGISITTMKQICRQLSIQRWPYRRPRRAHLKAPDGSLLPSCTPVQAEPADEAMSLEVACLASDAASESVIAKVPMAPGAALHDPKNGWHVAMPAFCSRDEPKQACCMRVNDAPISFLRCRGEAWSSCSSMTSSTSMRSMSSICTEPDSSNMIIEQTASQPAEKATHDIYPDKPFLTASAQASAESGGDGLSWLVPFSLSDDDSGEELEALLAWLE
jgi:hypothetical protein